MKKLLFIVLAVFMSACSSSDDNGCNDKSALVGKWELTKQEGYEISGENKEEWNKSDDFDATYVFNCDNTGKYTYYEHSDEEYSYHRCFGAFCQRSKRLRERKNAGKKKIQ